MSTAIKAQRTTVQFFDGLSVDGYEMPNGDFRVGITTASLVAGFADNYLRRTFSESGTRFKALQSTGFTGSTEISVRASKTGEVEERTISLKDFVRFVRYADKQGKPQAAALIDAFSELSVNDFFRDAFGKRPLSIDEKRSLFYSAYAASLSSEDWLAMDRDDIRDLRLGF